MLKPGEVVHVLVGTNPKPKDKFAICVDFDQGVYLFINSAADRYAGQSVLILQSEPPGVLDYDSHVSLKAVLLDPENVKQALATDKYAQQKGSIDRAAKTRILEGAESCKTLQGWIKKLIKEVFGDS